MNTEHKTNDVGSDQAFTKSVHQDNYQRGVPVSCTFRAKNGIDLDAINNIEQ